MKKLLAIASAALALSLISTAHSAEKTKTLLYTSPAPQGNAQFSPPRPKLMVLLVIDQFRADYLSRFQKRFLPAKQKNGDVGGFQYLMSNGAYFPMAQYQNLQSVTCAGHATLLTGAYPYQMGIVANFWWDTKQDKGVYCSEDTDNPAVGAPTEEHDGTSPKNLLSTTVGDELKNAGYPSKVVSIALKDRAAIMMGGHRADIAIWLDRDSREWISSKFYLPDGKLPEWMKKLSAETKPLPGQMIRWEAGPHGSGYSDPHRAAWVTKPNEIGPDFPHVLPAKAKWAISTPYGVDLTETAAEHAMRHYKLGQGETTDLLAVSFSAHDYMGHQFGPNSREVEEMTMHEDKAIAKLINYIRKNVPGGLNNVVFALTGDHGMVPDPDWLKKNRIDAKNIDEKEITRELNSRLNNKFGKPKEGEWIAYNHDQNIAVSRKALANRGANLREVIDEMKTYLVTIHGVAHVYTIFDYQEGKTLPGIFAQLTSHTYFPGRSGDVVVLPRPFFTIYGSESVSHQTGYSYDRMVPLVLSGPGIKNGTYPGHINVVDLAPTLSFLARVLPPAVSEGRVLTEALK